MALLLAVAAVLGAGQVAPGPAGADAGIVVDGLADLGPTAWRASGFLHADGVDPERAQALRPYAWRTGGAFGEYTDVYNRIRRHGAKVIWVLSDDWSNKFGNSPQWEDWAGYELFVRETVKRHLAEFPVDVWDIQNEPEGFAPRGGTQQNYLDIYLHTYKVIKEVDPDAKIVGPSSVRFQATPYVQCDPNALVKTYECEPLYAPMGRTQFGPKPGAQYLDLQTFLDFAAKPHPELGGKSMQFSHINWHELCIGDKDCNPHVLVDHVRQAREMIAARPSLGSPDVSINEYTGYQVTDVPGWIAGYIAALEEANVEHANKACWFEPSGATQCFEPMLNGLLGRDGTTPRSGYWVYKAYADMVGTRVPVTVANRVFSAYATRDDVNREVSLLLGRHETTCSAAPTIGCTPQPPKPTTQVTVDVKVPWAVSTVTVTQRRLAAPNVNLSPNVVGFSDVSSLTLPVVDGVVTIPIVGIGDGDAWQVLVDTNEQPAVHSVTPTPTAVCPVTACLHSGRPGTWSSTGSTFYTRSRAKAVPLDDGRVLLTGGYANNGARPWTKLYDPATGTFTTSAIGLARQQHTATVLRGGRVFVTGGHNPEHFTMIHRGEVIDVSRGTSVQTAEMRLARFDHVAALLPDGRVLLAGGYQGIPLAVAATNAAEIFDPSGNGGTGTFTPTASMSIPRAGATASVLPDGRVLVAGGTPAVGAVAASAEIYDPVTGTWSAAGGLQTGRAFHTASVLPSGDVLVVGGEMPVANGRFGLGGPVHTESLVIGKAELFRIATGSWVPAGEIEARGRHDAVVLRDGRVVVTGGVGTSGAHLASTFVYSPDAGMWEESSSMSTPRAYHTATALPGDKVLVVGGQDALPDTGRYSQLLHTLSSAELWKATHGRGPARR